MAFSIGPSSFLFGLASRYIAVWAACPDASIPTIAMAPTFFLVDTDPTVTDDLERTFDVGRLLTDIHFDPLRMDLTLTEWDLAQFHHCPPPLESIYSDKAYILIDAIRTRDH